MGHSPYTWQDFKGEGPVSTGGTGGPSWRRWDWNPARWSWVREGPASTKGTDQQALTVTWQTSASRPPLSCVLATQGSALSSEALGLWKGRGGVE